ncbi:MAG TPA: AAA family ATPase, partial [Chloroflexota bacterium]
MTESHGAIYTTSRDVTWAARLRYGRRTIQRWERAELPPDAAATEEVIRLCGELGLYRTYRQGELAGLSLSAELLRQLLGEARLASQAAASGSTPLAPAHNLPLDLTSFVGRERDLAQLAEMLETGRLVTITGPGGIGKTRLATQVATRLLDTFSDGVWLVELDGVADATTLPHRVADAVGAIEQRGEDIADTVVASLRPRHVMVVLDGCEHLLNTCAALVARLLGTCPRLRIVATSREPLAVPGEAIWRVEPLGLSETDGDDHLDRLTGAEAIRLFQDRASLVRRGFSVNAGNAAAVAEICRRLGAMPLALELAAAQVRVLSPEQIAERLQDRFGLLERETLTESRRHQTLEASIDWSYRLLDPPEQRVFESVSVFAGGFSLEAAEITCADAGVLKILTRLVDKSLVIAKPDVDAEVMRYDLLEPLRTYAAVRLRARGDAGEVRRRQGDWLITNAERVPGVIHGPEQRRWLGWVDRERANILEAATWWVQRGQPEIPLRLAAALYLPLGILGRGGETRLWLEPALRLTTVGLPVGIRAGAALGAAILAIFQGDRTAASYHLEDATGLAREARDESLVAGAWGADALLLQLSGRFDEAARMAEDGLPEVRRLGNKFMEARALEMQAAHALARGDSEAAKSLLEESARLARRTGDAYSLALAGAGLGDVARSRS